METQPAPRRRRPASCETPPPKQERILKLSYNKKLCSPSVWARERERERARERERERERNNNTLPKRKRKED